MKTTHEMAQDVIKIGSRKLRRRRALKTSAGAALAAGAVAGAFFLGISFPKQERGVDLVELAPGLSASGISIPGASELSLLSEDGKRFRTVANSAAIAFMRNDGAELSEYLADPGHIPALDDGNTEAFDNLKYSIIADQNDNYGTLTSDIYGVFAFGYTIYPASAPQYRLRMGLKQYDGDWKVVYIYLE